MSPRILGLLPMMSDTRIARRVDMLKQAGFCVEAVAFERHNRSGRLPDCSVESLGHIRDGKYAARIHKLLLAARKVRPAIRRNDIVYAFNPDLAGLALIAGAGLNRPVIVEVADITPVQVAGGWPGRVVRTIEKLIIERCRLLVLTTSGYFPYYREWLKTKTPGLVIENKLNAIFAASVRETGPWQPTDGPATEGPLRIGWFGQLRDEWSMRVLEGLTASSPQRFAAVLAGTPNEQIRDFFNRVASNPNIEFQGEYKHPDDLPRLYNSVDVVMACYPPSVPYGWPQSNRYYDACLFQKPLIVRAGCSDADEVKRHDIGLIIAAHDAEEAATTINDVSIANWMRWRANMTALPAGVYSSIDEAEVLRKALTEIANA